MLKLKSKKFIAFFLSIIFILLFWFGFLLNTLLNKVNIKPATDADLKLTEPSPSLTNHIDDNNIQNILLLGIDSNNCNSGRSDCIMILTLDKIHNKIKLSSIARDSYVVIKKFNKKDKINHAYAYGGPYLCINTINDNFDLNLSKYISVNFSSFPQLIDSIGGIQLTITDEELQYMNHYIHSINEINNTKSPDIAKTGTIDVDGTQALAYSRIRYTDGGDFERTHRQRIVISQIIKKFNSMKLFQQYSLLNTLLPLVETNLSKSEIIFDGSLLLSLKNSPVIEQRFPYDEDSSDKMINGVYYYVFNEENTKHKMHNFIFEEFKGDVK